MSTASVELNEALAYQRTVDKWLIERLWIDGPILLNGVVDKSLLPRAIEHIGKRVCSLRRGVPLEEFMTSEAEEIAALDDVAVQCWGVCTMLLFTLLTDQETQRALRERARARPS
jgi:hypothetical protein